LLKVAGSWTVKALSELGVGSKTALGYGRFADVEDVTGELLAELAQAKELELQKEQKTRAKEQVERMLASLSRGERLAYEISSLGQDARDQERSKGELYQEFLSLSRDDQIVAARALKEYWIKSGDWQKPSKKQKEKNIFLLRLLEST
jgi:CRISPR-associated protein Cmr6